MDTKEVLESRVKQFSGEYGDEIIGSVKALAEIDVKIKEALNEIERIDDELIQKHNELADMINGLIAKSAYGDDGGNPNPGCDMKIDVEIRVTKMPR